MLFSKQTGVDPCAILAARKKARKRHAREIKAANKLKKKAVLKLVTSSVNIYLCFISYYAALWCYCSCMNKVQSAAEVGRLQEQALCSVDRLLREQHEDQGFVAGLDDCVEP